MAWRLVRTAGARAVGAPAARQLSTVRKIELYDTTLRDGTQGEGVSLSLNDKLRIAEKLDDAGFDYIEGGYPLSNEKDVAFFERARSLALRSASICAFGMTRRRGVLAAADPGMLSLLRSEAPVCTIVGKTWDFHVTAVLRVSLEENIDMIGSSVGFLHGEGRRVIYDAEHFFDGWKANPLHARDSIRAAASASAQTIVLCDTNGGTTPEEVGVYTRAAIEALSDFPGVTVGVHCHNDCDLAVANSLAAVQAGASQVQGTINGIGERCGNADLISVAANLGLKRPESFSVLANAARSEPFSGLTELSRFVNETANLQLRPGQPFVGKSAFAHKGGMHAHAMQLASSSYEHIDPSLVGNSRRILVSELSGRSNISALTAASSHGRKVPLDAEKTKAVLAEVVRLEAQGYQFEAAQSSFELLVRKIAGEFKPHFKRIKYNVDVEGACMGNSLMDDALGAQTIEATVKLTLPDGTVKHEVAEGDGPVGALDAALRKALDEAYPTLRELHLVDFKASWVAITDAIESKLYKDDTRLVQERATKHAHNRVVEAAISASRQACALR
mmetsp:Transcript_11506/g.30143  ORF Transcript_11506/g.30143 Transcript_11506/m.30143 type:complete len:560 (+) Transcript_11506:1-1680(+)